jgi:molybdopterin-guanine dinucleotide biosynthesis protein A
MTVPAAATATAPLYGLVLVGGLSKRMGADKAALSYHGKPQMEHVLDLIAPYCEKTFLSCRADQTDQTGLAGRPQIHDTFFNMGPMAGILSALQAHPGSAFLVVACDLPFLDAPTLKALVEGRDPEKMATGFTGTYKGLPEPLCSIYEPKAFARMRELNGQGIDCPRKAMMHSPCRMLTPPDPLALTNANHPDDYQRALAALAERRASKV